jgi:hypothetical protein
VNRRSSSVKTVTDSITLFDRMLGFPRSQSTLSLRNRLWVESDQIIGQIVPFHALGLLRYLHELLVRNLQIIPFADSTYAYIK